MTSKISDTARGSGVRRHARGLRQAAAGATAVLLAACASAPIVPLVPTLRDGRAVVERGAVVLTAEVRPGAHQLSSDITPIRISVVNRGNTGIYVDPADIQLVATGEARRFAFIPAQALRLRTAVGLGLDPTSPHAMAQGASASNLAVARGFSGFVLDPSASYTSGHWRDPARAHLVDSAFRGGFIAAGESSSGFVFFDTPPEELGRVDLEVRVHAGSAGAPTRRLVIPYSVRE